VTVPEFINLLRRRARVIVVVLGATLCAALVLTVLAEATYEARAELLLREPAADPLRSQPASASRLLNNEISQMNAAVTRDAVRKAYTGPLEPSLVVASPASTDADVIVLTARAHQPDEVARLVNTYVAVYVESRRASELQALTAAGQLARQKAAEIQAAIDRLSQPLAELDRRIAAATGDAQLALRTQRQQVALGLDAELRALRDQLASYREQIDQIDLSNEVRRAGSLVVLRDAVAPDDPISPSPLRNLAWGLALGTVLALVAAYTKDEFDGPRTDQESLEQITGAPTLATVTRMRRALVSSGPLIDPSARDTKAAEEFRILRAQVLSLRTARPMQVLGVTSPCGAEGTTVIATNLGAALAEGGERVVVVRCDLRRPHDDGTDAAAPGTGLTSLLLGRHQLNEALWPHPDVPGLNILRTGPWPSNPSRVFDPRRIAPLLQTLRDRFDWVLLDCAPVLPVADTRVLAPSCDAMVLVVRDGHTSVDELQRASDALGHIAAPLVGTVVNFAGTDGGRGRRQPRRPHSAKTRRPPKRGAAESLHERLQIYAPDRPDQPTPRAAPEIWLADTPKSIRVDSPAASTNGAPGRARHRVPEAR
jgi:polysaccharide biosynthesis transport protein